MKRHHGVGGGFAPEVAPHDLEGGGRKVGLGGPQMPFAGFNRQTSPSKNHGSNADQGMKNILMIAGGIWAAGYLLMGYDLLWPLYLVLDLGSVVFEIPLLGSILSLIWTPISWLLSIFGIGGGHGAMSMMAQGEAAQEMHVAQSQLPAYVESYVQQYGDAALIFAAHDGYPQVVHGMLVSRDLGYRDLIDATDDNGNTALIYAAAKGFKQTSTVLLHAGADPDLANSRGGGRTALMEAAGSGHKDIVTSLRSANATLDMQDDLLNTALHYAAYHGHLQVVQELLKGDARRDIKNSYGHTPASYAMTNGNKGIADLLNRAPTRRELERKAAEKRKAEEEEQDPWKALTGIGKQKEKEALKKKKKAAAAEDKEEEEEEEEGGTNWLKMLQDNLKKASEGKHVKGAAEDLHKKSGFAPESEGRGISDEERKALEAQIAALKKQSEEAELKAQKRIVELLEKNSDQQRAVDDAEREARAHKMNATELHMRNQELHARHQASELQASEEKSRADRLHEELQDTRLEADRHKTRADGAERERDDHVQASRRHEDTIRRKQDEVDDYLQRLRRQSEEMERIREEVRQREADLRQHRARVSDLESSLRQAGGIVPATPPPSPPPVAAATPAPPLLERADTAEPARPVAEAAAEPAKAAEAAGEAAPPDDAAAGKDAALATLEADTRQET